MKTKGKIGSFEYDIEIDPSVLGGGLFSAFLMVCVAWWLFGNEPKKKDTTSPSLGASVPEEPVTPKRSESRLRPGRPWARSTVRPVGGNAHPRQYDSQGYEIVPNPNQWKWDAEQRKAAEQTFDRELMKAQREWESGNPNWAEDY